MAFNKAKALQEAERLVAQGRLSQAIKLYLEVAEQDPSDLTLLNTAGDLCVRERNIPEALRHFHRLADAYVREGFVLKAIAIYKKIGKLDPNAVEPLIKLAELYLGQGLAREALQLYAQSLEICGRQNRGELAIEIMRKIVALDPENTMHRARLAECCEALGRKAEAAQVYLETAEMALRREDASTAHSFLEKAALLDAASPKIALLRDHLAVEAQRSSATEAAAAPSPPELLPASEPSVPRQAESEAASVPTGSPEKPPAYSGAMPEAQPEHLADWEPHSDLAVMAEAAGDVIAAPPAQPEPALEETKATEAASPMESVPIDRPEAGGAPQLPGTSFALNEPLRATLGANGERTSEELDLSAEWEAYATGPPVTERPARGETAEPGHLESAPFNYEETRAEIDFYLGGGFLDQAERAVETLEARFPGNLQVRELREQVQKHRSIVSSPVEELPAASTDYGTVSESLPAPVSDEAAATAAAATAAPSLSGGKEPGPPETAGLAADLLGGLAADLEAGWAGLETQPASHPPGEAVEAEASSPDFASSLGALLEDLEKEDDVAAAKDPGSHYDLGVAFREMGLVDEAIGEFQKVVKAAQAGTLPSDFLPACSLLGLCFMEKNLPALAVRWYRRALEAPGLGEEAALSLTYDLGIAYERAGDAQAALVKFLEVYSQNIDYRDVAEKIRLLPQKPS